MLIADLLVLRTWQPTAFVCIVHHVSLQAVSDHHKQENEELRQRVDHLARAVEQVS